MVGIIITQWLLIIDYWANLVSNRICKMKKKIQTILASTLRHIFGKVKKDWNCHGAILLANRNISRWNADGRDLYPPSAKFISFRHDTKSLYRYDVNRYIVDHTCLVFILYVIICFFIHMIQKHVMKKWSIGIIIWKALLKNQLIWENEWKYVFHLDLSNWILIYVKI